MDWFGGGTRLWVVARHVHPGVRWRDMVFAGGMSAWGAYLTPFQTGAGPMMMWAMSRAGVRLPGSDDVHVHDLRRDRGVLRDRRARWPSTWAQAGRWRNTTSCSGSRYYDLFRTSLSIFGIWAC